MNDGRALLADPERLDALRRSGLLDTPPDESFDRLTRLAARTTRAPIAVLSLLDEGRQFFKSHLGLGEPWATLRETPISYSICAEAVAGRAPFIVGDTRRHPVLAKNASVADFGIGAYAGAPVEVDGRVIGVLAVLDVEPRRWTDDDVATLRDLAAVAEHEVRLRMAAAASLPGSPTPATVILSALRDGLLVLDPAGTILEVNDRVCEMTGFSRRDLIGRTPPFPFHSSEMDEETHRNLAVLLANGESGECELVWRRRSGDLFPVMASASPLFDEAGRVTGGVRIIRDLTDPLSLEAVRRTSEARSRSIVEGMHEGVVLQGVDGQITAANPAAERILGLTGDQLRGRTSLDPRWRSIHEDGSAFPGEDHPAMVALRTGAAQRNVVMGIHTPDSRLRWIRISAEPVVGAGGTLDGVVSSFVDVTELRQAQTAAEEGESRFRALADNAPVAMVETDVEGLGRWANRRWEERLRMHRGDALGLGWLDAVHEDDRAAMRDLCRATASTGEEHVMACRCLVGGGDVVEVDARFVVMRDPAGTPVACLVALTPRA